MRRYSTGSVFQCADGRWVGSYRDRNRIKGPVPSRKFIRDTREAAEQALDAYLDEQGYESRFHRHEDKKAARAAARALGSHTEMEWHKAAVYECYYCGVRLTPFTITKDHMLPISRGGSDSLANIVSACKACNFSKGQMTTDEYFEWMALRA